MARNQWDGRNRFAVEDVCSAMTQGSRLRGNLGLCGRIPLGLGTGIPEWDYV
jgi:hypothetical protein